MTRTTLNPKVSSLGSDPAPKGVSLPSDNHQIRDAYGSAGANPYKNIISGQPRAASLSPDDSTPIGDMMNEIRGVERGPRMDPMQAYLSTLMMGDDVPGPTPSDFELPNVPLLQRDILRRNRAGLGMGAIVERYSALEKVIKGLMSNAQRTINSADMSQISAHEIESLRDYKGLLRERLILCREQLAEAQRVYRQEQIDNPVEHRLDGDIDIDAVLPWIRNFFDR